MMLPEKYTQLDTLAVDNQYVVPPDESELAYTVYFRKTCARYHINFAEADQDERDFVIHMAEKGFHAMRA